MATDKKVVKKPVKKAKNDTSIINKVNNHKKALLIALEKCNGNVSEACLAVKISRTQFYNYVNSDTDFATSFEEIQEGSIDFVESKLFEKIKGVTVMGREEVYEVPPSDTAIIFFLKTRGRKRGYVEKIENLNTNVNVNVEPTQEEAKKIKESFDKDF